MSRPGRDFAESEHAGTLVTSEIGLEDLNQALGTLADGRAIRQVVRL